MTIFVFLMYLNFRDLENDNKDPQFLIKLLKPCYMLSTVQ